MWQRRGDRFVETDDRLGAQRAVLGGAEGEDIDARFPRQLGCRGAAGDHRIGETRAVHVRPS